MVEEYCWAITQAAGGSYSGLSVSCELKFGFRMDSLVYMHTQFNIMCTYFLLVPDLPRRKYCISWGAAVVYKFMFAGVTESQTGTFCYKFRAAVSSD